jgi:hypothetical protein
MPSRQTQHFTYVALTAGILAPWALFYIAGKIYDPIDIYWSGVDWIIEAVSSFSLCLLLFVISEWETKSKSRKIIIRIFAYLVLVSSLVILLTPRIRA